MTFINLSDQQARYLATAKPDKLVLVEPLSKQPPEGWVVTETDIGAVAFTDELDEHDSYMDTKLPHRPSSTVGLRETWGYGVKRYRYKADLLEYPYYHGCWFSPAIMPTKAIRHLNWKVNSVRVCRVQGFPISDYVKTGIVDPNDLFLGNVQEYTKKYTPIFKEYFNSRYSHPRPRMKGGKVVEYECWCYDRHPRLRFSGEPTYKDKPLAIHINPFVAVTTIERGKHD